MINITVSNAIAEVSTTPDNVLNLLSTTVKIRLAKKARFQLTCWVTCGHKTGETSMTS